MFPFLKLNFIIDMLSVIIPTYNERPNIDPLIKRLINSLRGSEFELIFVDDHSSDGTYEYLSELAEILPIKLLRKQGQRGKAYSLLQGFSYAEGDVIAMIDADLQYPPEAIPLMAKKLKSADIIIGKRQPQEKNLRSFLSSAFESVFGRLVLGLNCDVQSGLKVFRSQILNHLRLKPTAWGFDYEFLFKAKKLGWKIDEYNVPFSAREKGKSSINIFTAGLELAWGAFKLRVADAFKRAIKFLDWPHPSERIGNNYGNTKDFLFLPEIFSIRRHIYPETVALIIAVTAFIGAALWGLSTLFDLPVLVVVSAFFAAFYLGLMVFKLVVIYNATRKPFVDFSREEVDSVREDELPTYSILIPLYNEAAVIRQIIKAMSAIDYPKDKLDIIITLEEYDHETIQAIKDANPPAYFKTLILPDVQPKTKPKALNVAFPHTKGEFLVIYDAEIVPDPDQLKKAYLAFRKHPDVSVFQTRQDHYNPGQSLITKLFNAEFSFHFDMYMPGLIKMGLPLPLAGHSTHFRRAALEEAGAWDPYNVTEDADVGIRLARLGHKVDILNSRSTEEATTTIKAWVNQRSRWIKGFIQTAIVHLRHPLRTKNELGGWGKAIALLILVPSSVFINISNLFFWGLLIAWFATQSTVITAMFPTPILYLSFFTFVAGTTTFTYLNLVGIYKRGRYSLVKYSLLSPLYWVLLAYASVKAAIQLVVNPHHWDKTKHGVHLNEPADEPIKVKRYAT
jgi:cellulose synthase/poly-beta-1,6-N-acetylglucosamine synthase-like glycosyltransferase